MIIRVGIFRRADCPHDPVEPAERDSEAEPQVHAQPQPVHPGVHSLSPLPPPVLGALPGERAQRIPAAEWGAGPAGHPVVVVGAHRAPGPLPAHPGAQALPGAPAGRGGGLRVGRGPAAGEVHVGRVFSHASPAARPGPRVVGRAHQAAAHFPAGAALFHRAGALQKFPPDFGLFVGVPGARHAASLFPAAGARRLVRPRGPALPGLLYPGRRQRGYVLLFVPFYPYPFIILYSKWLFSLRGNSSGYFILNNASKLTILLIFSIKISHFIHFFYRIFGPIFNKNQFSNRIFSFHSFFLPYFRSNFQSSFLISFIFFTVFSVQFSIEFSHFIHFFYRIFGPIFSKKSIFNRIFLTFSIIGGGGVDLFVSFYTQTRVSTVRPSF